MAHELKYRYVYGIPGKPETYFFRYFTIEEIEYGNAIDEICDCPLLREYKIISRDQFTGLKDKNGTEIYENDLWDCGWDNPQIVKYRHNEAAFELIDSEYNEQSDFTAGYNRTGKIIGNIYGVK